MDCHRLRVPSINWWPIRNIVRAQVVILYKVMPASQVKMVRMDHSNRLARHLSIKTLVNRAAVTVQKGDYEGA